jgi:hypothetical protein
VILKKMKGDPLPLLCATLKRVVETHHMAENALPRNHLLTLSTWSMLIADAYRQPIPKGEGTGDLLKKLQEGPTSLTVIGETKVE